MSCIISYTFMANLITIIRVILLFVGVGFIYSRNIYGEILAFAIVIIVIIMDWIDGYVARRRGNTTPFGAVLDIMGDRIVESSLWIVFAHIHLIPVWVPIVVIVRGVITDSLRSVALTKGKTPFGEKTMIKTAVGRLIVSSRLSRALYGSAKVVTFCYLILYLAYIEGLKASPPLFTPDWQASLYGAGMTLVHITVFMCVVRAVPVITDSIEYFR